MFKKELLIIGQKSWHDEVRIVGNREGLLALSEEIRKAATGHYEESPVFLPPDGECFQVMVEPIGDGTIGQYSPHYCDLHDPDRNLLPKNIVRAVVYAETVDGEMVIRTFDDVKNGEPTTVLTRIDPNPDEADGRLMTLLMSDFGQKADSSGQLRSGTFWKLLAITRAFLDIYYPANIFAGESGDKGPGFIRRLREALKGIEDRE